MYRSPNTARVIKPRRLRWSGHVARMEEGRSAFKILTGTPTGKRPLGRPRRRWEDNIRIDLKEVCINAKNWVHSAQDKECLRTLECNTESPDSISHGVSSLKSIMIMIMLCAYQRCATTKIILSYLLT